MNKGAKAKRANVRQMDPTYPDVRCRDCKTVYRLRLPKDSGLSILKGECPKCGGEKFNTVIIASAGI